MNIVTAVSFVSENRLLLLNDIHLDNCKYDCIFAPRGGAVGSSLGS